MKRLGMKPSTSVLELKKMKADAEVAKALQLKEGAEVIFFSENVLLTGSRL